MVVFVVHSAAGAGLLTHTAGGSSPAPRARQHPQPPGRRHRLPTPRAPTHRHGERTTGTGTALPPGLAAGRGAGCVPQGPLRQPLAEAPLSPLRTPSPGPGSAGGGGAGAGGVGDGGGGLAPPGVAAAPRGPRVGAGARVGARPRRRGAAAPQPCGKSAAQPQPQPGTAEPPAPPGPARGGLSPMGGSHIAPTREISKPGGGHRAEKPPTPPCSGLGVPRLILGWAPRFPG